MQLKWRERSLLDCQFVEKKGNKEKKSPNELLLREREKKLNSKFRLNYCGVNRKKIPLHREPNLILKCLGIVIDFEIKIKIITTKQNLILKNDLV